MAVKSVDQSQFGVATELEGWQIGSTIASLADGGYVVAWQSDEGFYFGIHAQRFSAGGSKIGAEFHVNAMESDSQFAPVAVGLEDGG